MISHGAAFTKAELRAGVVGYRKLRSQSVNFRFAPESSATRTVTAGGRQRIRING